MKLGAAPVGRFLLIARFVCCLLTCLTAGSDIASGAEKLGPIPGSDGSSCVRILPHGAAIFSNLCPEFRYEWSDPSHPQACELKRVESYDLRLDGQGHALIPLVLDKPRMMIVDTGGARSELYSSVVNEMKLPTTDADEAARKNAYPFGKMVAFNGYVSDTVAVVPSVSFGVLKFANPTFSVVGDSRTPPLADNEVAGALGPSHLMTFDVEFDFAAGKMNLYLQNFQDNCADRLVYWSNRYAAVPFTLSPEGHIRFVMRLDGKDVKAVLDSGAPFSSIDSDLAFTRFKVEGSSGGSNTGSHGARLAVHRFQSLAIGGVEFRNPELVLVPDEVSLEANSPVPDVILGLREMSFFHIFIAYSQSRIYLTLANPTEAKTERSR